jgi:hypothetical protein
MKTANIFSAVGLLALGGCALTPALSGQTDAARIDEVERVISENVSAFFQGMSLATCEDGSPVSRFAKDGTIYVLEDEVITVSLEEYDAGVEYRACNWDKHGGGVDSILVDVLAPDVANAAWTYHDIITLKDGKVRQTRGAVLQTWKLEDGEWLITATKTSEILISLE